MTRLPSTYPEPGAQWPSADEVAVAVVTAVRLAAAGPLDSAQVLRRCEALVSGEVIRKDIALIHGVSRARAYAALALADLFPGVGPIAVSRMCGSTTPSAHLGTMRHRIHHSTAPWYDPAMLALVRAAVQVQAEETAGRELVVRRGSGLVTRLETKRPAVAPQLCEDQTPDLMGDPPPGRSALAEHQEREARAAAEADEFGPITQIAVRSDSPLAAMIRRQYAAEEQQGDAGEDEGE